MSGHGNATIENAKVDSGHVDGDVKHSNDHHHNHESGHLDFDAMLDEEDGSASATSKPQPAQSRSAGRVERAQALIDKLKDTADYYEILGVSQEATESDLKIAYRKKAVLVHPDKCTLPGAKEAFQALSNAHMCLTDPDKRMRYDMGEDEDEDFEDDFDYFSEIFMEMMMQERMAASEQCNCTNCRRNRGGFGMGEDFYFGGFYQYGEKSKSRYEREPPPELTPEQEKKASEERAKRMAERAKEERIVEEQRRAEIEKENR